MTSDFKAGQLGNKNLAQHSSSDRSREVPPDVYLLGNLIVDYVIQQTCMFILIRQQTHRHLAAACVDSTWYTYTCSAKITSLHIQYIMCAGLQLQLWKQAGEGVLTSCILMPVLQDLVCRFTILVKQATNGPECDGHIGIKLGQFPGGINILSTIICSACQPYCE